MPGKLYLSSSNLWLKTQLQNLVTSLKKVTPFFNIPEFLDRKNLNSGKKYAMAQKQVPKRYLQNFKTARKAGKIIMNLDNITGIRNKNLLIMLQP